MPVPIRKILYLVLVASLTIPECAQAYIGPGAGVSAIGTVLALFGAVIMAIAGFIWYPIKRLLARFRKKGAREISL